MGYMSKAVAGIAEIAGGIALDMTGIGAALGTSLMFAGISMEAGAIADALTQNRGEDITTRQPASFRQVIYGEQRVGGVMIYQSTTGSHHDQYNMVIVVATHEVDAISALYLDGRKVYFDSSSAGSRTSPGGVAFGGQADGNDHIGPNGQHYNFGGLVYCEARYGDQADGDVIGGLTANDPVWAADSNGNSPYVGGCSYVYLKIEFDNGMFPQFPEIKFTVRGKNNIYDPRTGTTGYTSNAALIVADMIIDSVWGLNDNTVNQTQLIAAANVCDESVTLANGQTESRYACHYHYDTSVPVGSDIAMALRSCGGRLVRTGGEWYIFPAYWLGSSFTADENSLVSSIQWDSFKSLPELSNRVEGTYTAPNYPYNVAGNLYDTNGYYEGQTQDNFPFAFQPTNYPQYAEDELHGYGTGVDVFLTQDGGLPLPMQLDLPCVLSVAQAQRLAKIALLRNRQQGSGMLPMSLAAYTMMPTDIMEFSFAPHNWTNKYLEVKGITSKLLSSNSATPAWWLQVEVQETDPSIYEWATTEELTVYDVPAQTQGLPYIVEPPTNLSIEDDSTTAMTLADGNVVPRLLVTWTPPQDIYVNDGGKIEIQYQFVTNTNTIQPLILSPIFDSVKGVYNSAWVDAGAVSGDATFTYIPGISPFQYQNISVRVRSVRTSGAYSEWVTAGASLTLQYPRWPIFDPGGNGPVLTYGGDGPSVFSLQPAQAGADVTSQNAALNTANVGSDSAQTVLDNIGTALSTANSALTKADGKASVTVGTTAPSSPSTGDIWYDTSVTPEAAKIWNGTAWVAADSAAQSAAGAANTAAAAADTLANSKAEVTLSSTAPSNPNTGDVWVDNTNSTQLAVKTWNGSAWIPSADVTSQNAAKTIQLPDKRSTNSLPSYYRALGVGIYTEFKAGITIGAPESISYVTLYSEVLWSDTSGGPIVQWYTDSNSSNTYTRIGSSDDSAWGAWSRVQAGADITSQNTSKDTTAVNGVASGSVAQGATGINANLIPDAGIQFGWTYWGGAPPSASWEIYPTPSGNVFNIYNAGGTIGAVISNTFLLRAGSYVLSYYYEGSGIASGEPNIDIFNPETNAVFGSDYPTPNSSGRRSFSFTLSSDTTVTVLINPYQVTWSSGGTGIQFGSFMLQAGSVATAYVPNILDQQTGYLKAGAAQIDFGSGIHLNKVLDNIGDGTNFARVATSAFETPNTQLAHGAMSTATQNAIDGLSNLQLKNKFQAQYTGQAQLTSTAATLPANGGIGLVTPSSNGSTPDQLTVNFTPNGNLVLVSVNLFVESTTQGGQIQGASYSGGASWSTSQGAVSPSYFPTVTISGDGSGATAGFSFQTSQSGHYDASTGQYVVTDTTYTVNGVTITNAGSGYTSATATVTVPSDWTDNGLAVSGFSFSTANSAANVPFQIAFVVDGANYVLPKVQYTDGQGVGNYIFTTILSLSNVSHTVELQGYTTSADAVFVTQGFFNLVELG